MKNFKRLPIMLLIAAFLLSYCSIALAAGPKPPQPPQKEYEYTYVCGGNKTYHQLGGKTIYIKGETVYEVGPKGKLNKLSNQLPDANGYKKINGLIGDYYLKGNDIYKRTEKATPPSDPPTVSDKPSSPPATSAPPAVSEEPTESTAPSDNPSGPPTTSEEPTDTTEPTENVEPTDTSEPTESEPPIASDDPTDPNNNDIEPVNTDNGGDDNIYDDSESGDAEKESESGDAEKPNDNDGNGGGYIIFPSTPEPTVVPTDDTTTEQPEDTTPTTTDDTTIITPPVININNVFVELPKKLIESTLKDKTDKPKLKDKKALKTKNTKDKSNDNEGTPQTGDEFNAKLAVGLLIFAAVGIMIACILRKKQ